MSAKTKEMTILQSTVVKMVTLSDSDQFIRPISSEPLLRLHNAQRPGKQK